MRERDVLAGCAYEARVSGRLVSVLIEDRVERSRRGRIRVMFQGRNLYTGRTVMLSAARLRRPCPSWTVNHPQWGERVREVERSRAAGRSAYARRRMAESFIRGTGTVDEMVAAALKDPSLADRIIKVAEAVFNAEANSVAVA